MKEEVLADQTIVAAGPVSWRRVSWGAIWAGFFVTLVIQVMLTLLGAGFGAAAINPASQHNSGNGLALGSAIWLVVTGLISLFIGGYVAGRMSGGPRRADGLLHGIVTWSLTEMATILLLMTAIGGLMGGIGSLLGGAIGIAQYTQGGQGTLSSTQQQLEQLYPQPGSIQPTGRTQNSQSGSSNELASLAQQDPELGGVLARLEAKGGAAKDAQDRDQLLNLLTTQHGMNQQQASHAIDQWDQQFQQTKGQVGQQARQVAQQATQGISTAAFAGFVAMILGLVVAAWGGWTGTASIPLYRAVTPPPRA